MRPAGRRPRLRRGCALALATAALAAPACEVRSFVLLDRDAAGADVPAPPFDGADARPAPRAEGLGVGIWHTCVVLGGPIRCWGENVAGALGVGDTVNRAAPVTVAAGVAWVRVESGDGATCARDVDGAVWCWGSNVEGQLGQGDVGTPRPTPVRVPLARPASVLAMNYTHACVVLDDASLWCWGNNWEGQLGQSDRFDAPPTPTPVRVGTDADWTTVATGQGHTCGLRRPGTLWCWGRNTDSQLGLGTGSGPQLRTPTRVGAEADWIAVAADLNHTCAIRQDGSLWCWGANGSGQLGLPGVAMQPVPARVGSESDWVEVSVNTFVTCGRRRGGTLWCWGRNIEGQLGVGDITDRNAPTQVGTDTDWVEVGVGWFHTCARKADGAVLCTGENRTGQLGVGDPNRRNVFSRVNLAEP